LIAEAVVATVPLVAYMLGGVVAFTRMKRRTRRGKKRTKTN